MVDEALLQPGVQYVCWRAAGRHQGAHQHVRVQEALTPIGRAAAQYMSLPTASQADLRELLPAPGQTRPGRALRPGPGSLSGLGARKGGHLNVSGIDWGV